VSRRCRLTDTFGDYELGERLNETIIPAKGVFYVLEDIDAQGNTTLHGLAILP